MANDLNLPREFDAVLGGHSPPPVEGAILGGIEGVKQLGIFMTPTLKLHCLTDPVLTRPVTVILVTFIWSTWN